MNWASMERDFVMITSCPENKTYLQQYKIDVFPVTNGEYIKFMNDDGYHNYKYWLADRWDEAGVWLGGSSVLGT